MSDTQSVGEAFPAELERCRKLLKVYEGIPTGFFGACVISTVIKDAEAAQASGDVVAMVQTFARMKECE